MLPHVTVSGPLLVIVGGSSDGRSAICDCWIHDLTTMKWKKVICVVHVYTIINYWSSATTP